MSERARIGLDNPAFSGRLRQPVRRAQLSRASSQRPSARYFQDVVAAPSRPWATKPAKPTAPTRSAAKPALHRPKSSQVLKRQAVQRPTRRTRRLRKGRRHSSGQKLLLAMATVVFLAGIGASFMTMQTNKVVKTQVSALTQQAENGTEGSIDSATPSEDKPSSGAVASYKVAPDQPMRIKINRLGVDARIKSLSVTAKGELQAPYNIYDAGWYSSSAKPGDGPGSGAMLIDGHVHGPTLPGVFVGLKKLTAGDAVQVTRGDGKTYTYSVVRVQNYDADKLDMAMMLSSAKPGVAGLNLITCGGQYDKDSGEYKQRTAVFAVQQS